MSRRRFDFSWIFLCILVGLFILSVRCPRGWQRIARSSGLSEPTPAAESPKLLKSTDLTLERRRPGVVEPAPRLVHAAPRLNVPAPRLTDPVPKVAHPTPQLSQPPIARLVEPAPRIAARADEPQPTVPPEAIERPAWEKEELLVKMLPSPVAAPRDLSPRGALPSGAPYPDTGLAPLKEDILETLEPPPAAVPQVPSAPPVAKAEPVWQDPEALFSRLDALARHAATNRWATETVGLVRKLGPAMTANSAETNAVLQRLDELTAQAQPLAATLRDRSLAQGLLRAGHALQRRTGIWGQVAALHASAPSGNQAQADDASIGICLAEIENLTRGTEEGQAWRNFLLVDALEQWRQRRKSADQPVPGDLAQEVLRRMDENSLSVQQRQFMSSGPVAALEMALLRGMPEPAGTASLLRHLERYEQTGLASDARQLARDIRYLAAAPGETPQRLAQSFDANYRNHNLRVAISERLLNRLVPKRDPEYAPVNDRVLGVPVHGDSLTSTEVKVRLLPDPQRVRLALEISGEVASLTTSTSGPATFFNDSEAMYTARKPLEIDLKGIRLGETEVDVHNRTRLRGLRTDFDRFPLLNRFAEGVARSEHERKQPQANAEVREKVAARAQERIDTETTTQLAAAAQRLQTNVFGPMYALALEPTLIAAETTDERFVMRLRLAGKDQLGGHTPRPQAPSDSLASFQVHESALNNVLSRLDLDGRTFTLPELSKHIARRLSRPHAAETNPDREDVTITFASRDAARVRCSDGRLEFTLSVARLAKPPRAWKDFQVRAIYRPEINGRSVQLVRDGVVQLIGPRLNTGGQIAMRGIFSKAFSKTAPWNLTPERLAKDPRLADLGITQFVIDDGWIAVALGPALPQRTVVRPGLLRR